MLWWYGVANIKIMVVLLLILCVFGGDGVDSSYTPSL